MAVIEGLILGRDEQVRGANVRVITKGKIVHLSRPIQKLYPIEVSAELKEATRPKLMQTRQRRSEHATFLAEQQHWTRPGGREK